MQRPVRRKEREIEGEEILNILDTSEYGTLSMVDADGSPYGIPISFVRSGNRLIVHCAREGRKLECLRHNPKVSFCAVGRTKIIPGRFSTEYESAIVEGIAEIIHDEQRKIDDLMKLVKKYDPSHLDIASKYIDKSLHRTEIIEILIDSFTGKAKKTTA